MILILVQCSVNSRHLCLCDYESTEHWHAALRIKQLRDCFRSQPQAPVSPSMDPWLILPQERMRHMEQFTGVGPKDGFITGAQARGFFMQSGLPPMVLAQIW